MAPILITGGTGQLAEALAAEASRRGLAVARLGRPAFDFERPDRIIPLLRSIGPRLIVNAAAYTAVDRAESEPDAAMRANGDGPGLLARYCAEADIPLIHISTDYVFDGTKGTPYREEDPTNPLGVYGRSKHSGETAVLAASAKSIILRTSWVHAPEGRNFVRTMLALGATRERLRVVADQRGCPTLAGDLAEAILAIAARILDEGWDHAFGGLFHAAGGGATTWHGLASAVFEEAGRYGGPQPIVEPIATADFPTAARRPADSRLDCARLERVFGIVLPPWRDALSRAIETIYRG